MNKSYRFAEEKDIPLVLKFIKELSVYEKMEDQVIATETTLKEWLFEKKIAEVIFPMENNIEVGFALFFHNYSTFVGRAGLYLEDIYIMPQYRNRGHGKSIFKILSKIAVERNCGRFEWSCLDWNEPSIQFYKSLGAVPMNGWTVYRLTEEKFKKIAEEQ
ncbi:GNAT family N-acetyltransferase [Acholeplasma hippikon]|uniref:Predicted acetyltransferase n=1 Tax=Acholeplasma hippikon TaxID=264636 RepID=A0A449BIN3_9MOLU|nr:GNAT family N-acetyltransferase [Acholeplasma hippikon]VEU82315.1 Predicted acetyltransferase [Acholeplasma hippikon]